MILTLQTKLISFFHSISQINDNDFDAISIPPGAYELESLNDEFKRIVIKEEYFTEANYPFFNKPNFSALGSIIEISSE